MQLSGQEKIPTRKVRHFAVYKGTRLIFKVENKAGTLQSVAQAGAAAKHAWVNTLSFRATGEAEWQAILRQAKNFDGFLKLLVANGYDLFSIDKAPAPLNIDEGHRIAEGPVLVAVIWAHPGQLSTIAEQPEVGFLTSKVASVVLYDTQKGNSFAQIFERAKSYEAILEAIKSTRLKATSV